MLALCAVVRSAGSRFGMSDGYLDMVRALFVMLSMLSFRLSLSLLAFCVAFGWAPFSRIKIARLYTSSCRVFT